MHSDQSLLQKPLCILYTFSNFNGGFTMYRNANDNESWNKLWCPKNAQITVRLQFTDPRKSILINTVLVTVFWNLTFIVEVTLYAYCETVHSLPNYFLSFSRLWNHKSKWIIYNLNSDEFLKCKTHINITIVNRIYTAKVVDVSVDKSLEDCFYILKTENSGF